MLFELDIAFHVVVSCLRGALGRDGGACRLLRACRRGLALSAFDRVFSWRHGRVSS